VGTRSAVFTPLPELGLIIVDEEHDDSFKQQEGLRYHGRAIAIWRAQTEDIPIVLGSATPSLNLLYNTEQRHFPVLHLTQRAGGAQPPKINLVDLRHNTITEGLAEVSWKALSQALEAGNQALVFVNRRGYAPVLICKHCGWQAPCPNCDSLATVHKNDQQLRCHHCGWKEPQPQRCKQCGSQHLEVLGQGTQRVEAALQQRLNYPVIRVDRDVVNKRQQHELIMHQMHKGEPCVLVGTQMLAKGHDFPDLTLVVIVNLDQGLFSADFRAPERLAQLVEQVAGRAGRAKKTGQVLIQTYLPEDPFYQTLIHQGYDKLSQDLLNARKEAELPPYTFMALVRAASKKDRAAFDFLKEMSDAVINNHPHVTLEGPASSMLTRRAGKYRAYLQLSATNRKALHLCLDALQQSGETLRFNGSWSIDVDPAEMG
ncbi:MAG: replication restart helicase PriA, partial [bacterium]